MRDYNGWESIFNQEFSQPYFLQLKEFLVEEYATKTVYPPKRLLFNAFDTTSFADTCVVILGQDPYIHEGQAMGLAFSVPQNFPIPPSLANIKKEIFDDTGKESVIVGGDLTPWAKQGILLLNTTLSVQKGLSNSHKGRGWETFTDAVISGLNKKDNNLVFLLWGANAISKRKLITNPNHLVLTAPHPSPLSAYQGFFGCKHFSKTNAYLENFYKEIIW